MAKRDGKREKKSPTVPNSGYLLQPRHRATTVTLPEATIQGLLTTGLHSEPLRDLLSDPREATARADLWPRPSPGPFESLPLSHFQQLQ